MISIIFTLISCANPKIVKYEIKPNPKLIDSSSTLTWDVDNFDPNEHEVLINNDPTSKSGEILVEDCKEYKLTIKDKKEKKIIDSKTLSLKCSKKRYRINFIKIEFPYNCDDVGSLGDFYWDITVTNSQGDELITNIIRSESDLYKPKRIGDYCDLNNIQQFEIEENESFVVKGRICDKDIISSDDCIIFNKTYYFNDTINKDIIKEFYSGNDCSINIYYQIEEIKK